MHSGPRQGSPGERTLPLPEFPAEEDPANCDAAEADARPGMGGLVRHALEASAEAIEVAAEFVMELVRFIVP
jgi:hypothetical protein